MACTHNSSSVESRGINPSSEGEEDVAALLEAAKDGRLNDVKYLITAKNYDPSSQDEDGQTALHFAASEGHLEVVKCLIEIFNVNPVCSDKHGKTPLHLAAKWDKQDVLRYLIVQNRCDPMSQDEAGMTPLHIAGLYGHLQMVKCLIDEFGVDPNSCRDNMGQTPLHLAVTGNKRGFLKYFKGKCCDPMSRDKKDQKALHSADLRGRLQIVKCLIDEFGVDPTSCRDNKGQTPLHLASELGWQNVVEILVEHKHCDHMSQDDSGWTALHFAAIAGKLPIVKYLANKFDELKSCKDTKGQTPLDVARQNSKQEIVEFLEKMSRGEGGSGPLRAGASSASSLSQPPRNWKNDSELKKPAVKIQMLRTIDNPAKHRESTLPSRASREKTILGKKPAIGQLSLLKFMKDGDKVKVDIIKNASHRWKKIALQLAPKDANLVTRLSERHQLKHEDCLHEVFVEHFINKKPDNYTNDWAGLIELLDDVDLSELSANVREAVLLILSNE